MGERGRGAQRTGTAYSHGQHEYSLPPGVAPTPTQPAGASWYVKAGAPPPGARPDGGPPHDTAYSLGAHLLVHVAGPLVDAQPEHLVGSSEMQSWLTPGVEPPPEAPTPPSHVTPEG
jgi:hypothetical protein